MTASSIIWPAVRTVNRSPRPWSKMISGGTRESAQASTAASGFWPSVSMLRVSLSCHGCSALPSAKRLLPWSMRLQVAFAVDSCMLLGKGEGEVCDSSDDS